MVRIKDDMSLIYEELDFQPTPIGDLMLRRRRSIQLGGLDIYGIKRGDHFSMSSLFHEAAVQLCRLELDAILLDIEPEVFTTP